MPLRAVSADEKPPSAKALKSVTQAASSGSKRELLVAMRDRTAKAVESPTTMPRDLAALTRRLMEIVQEIESIDQAAEQEAASGDVPDEEFDASAV